MKSLHWDAASLEIMWNRLIQITEEAWVTLWRTSFSLIVGEAQDFGIEILDPHGNSLAHAPRSMPVFNLSLPRAVKELLKIFPPESLQPGDVLITNDPWISAGHLYDVAIVTPVFKDGRLLAFVGSIAHWSDIGGALDSMSVREIFDEGLQIPPLKLYDRGKLNGTLLAMIERNVRRPSMVIGDLHAQLNGNMVAVKRLLDLAEEYHLDDFSELAVIIQSRSEAATREAISRIKDGRYEGTVTFDGLGHPLELNVVIDVHGDSLTVDWTNVPPQVDRGGINCTYSYTASHTAYALKCILTPDVPSNQGCYKPFHIITKPGTILDCERPASVNLRTMTGWYIAPAIFMALADALPDRVQAFTGLPMGLGAYGPLGHGEWFQDHLFQGGGQGASAHGDGKNGLLFPTSAANTSVELFEARTPLVVQEKTLIQDSGGAGTYRGGLGQRVVVRKLYNDGLPVYFSPHPQGMVVQTPGLFGGLPGKPADVYVMRWPDGEVLDRGLHLRGLVELRSWEEALVIELAGGSGYGDPAKRSRHLVEVDLKNGYVSQEAARSVYRYSWAGN